MMVPTESSLSAEKHQTAAGFQGAFADRWIEGAPRSGGDERFGASRNAGEGTGGEADGLTRTQGVVSSGRRTEPPTCQPFAPVAFELIAHFLAH